MQNESISRNLELTFYDFEMNKKTKSNTDEIMGRKKSNNNEIEHLRLLHFFPLFSSKYGNEVQLLTIFDSLNSIL